MSSGEHYFSKQPAVRSRPVPVHVRLPDLQLDLESDRGVFAYGELDRGTELLLRSIPPPPQGALLDLGCGYGAVAITIATRNAAAHVWAVDVNERAVELTQRNARRVGLANVTACTPEQVPVDVRFAALYSNPPVRVGKEALHELLTHWLDRLTPQGRGYLVMQRNLGADSLSAWLQERGHAAERRRSRGGYRILEVHPRPATPHD